MQLNMDNFLFFCMILPLEVFRTFWVVQDFSHSQADLAEKMNNLNSSLGKSQKSQLLKQLFSKRNRQVYTQVMMMMMMMMIMMMMMKCKFPNKWNKCRQDPKPDSNLTANFSQISMCYSDAISIVKPTFVDSISSPCPDLREKKNTPPPVQSCMLFSHN